MKAKFLLFITFYCIHSTFLQAQECVRTAQMQDGPDYTITGVATLEYLLDGTKTLKLNSDFNTSSGPDLDIYLTNASTVAASTEKVNLSALTSPSGAQNYTIPNSIAINEYDYIVIHCTQYNHHWGHGEFLEATGAACSTLNTETFSINSFEIQPNPAKNFIQISNIDLAEVEIRIFDILGKMVYRQPKGSLQNKISVSEFNTGVYLVSIYKKGQRFSKKIIVQ